MMNLKKVVVGYDGRGFGKSEGLRGYLESVEKILSDSETFINAVVDYY